ncbi:MAG TPA: hypothetical protein VGO58_05620, partial [Chitinophagaceae bacterium]|nr:hypothetical protein [Chitinophagaceae bacterium]
MRKMLFLLLLFPLVASAQRDDWDLAYQKNTPDSLTRPIHLPERDYNPYFSYYDTMRYESAIRVVVIREDSIYRKLFWRYTYTND